MIRRYMTAAIVALALVAGACGGGGSDKQSNGVASVDGKQTSSKTNSGEKADPQDAALAYAKCMRRNGAEVPDPDANGMFPIEPGSKVPDSETMKTADEACKAERDALQGSMGEPDKDFEDKALKMSRCMREQGVNMPDPKPSEGGGTSVDLDEDLINDPAFKKAQSTCSKQVGMPEPGAAAKGGK